MRRIIDNFHNISIKKKLIVLTLLMLIYPIILVVIFGVYNNEKIIKDRFVRYVENDVLNAKIRISNDIQDMEKFFQDMLYNIDVYELFKAKPNQVQKDDSIVGYRFKRDMEKYLNSTIYARQEFDFITMQFINDDQVYYAAKETGFMDIKDIPTDIFSTIDDNKVNYYFDKVGSSIHMYLVRPIYDVESFNKIGNISIKISNEYLENMAGMTYKEPSETTYIYTQNGDKILTVGEDFNNGIIEESKVYLENNGTYKRNIKGVDYYVIVETIDHIQLKIISMVSTKTLIADTRKVTNLILVLCLVSVPIYILLANLMHSEIVSPFNILVSKMRRIEKGELDTVIDIERENEVGYLYNSFNSMSKRLKYLVEYVYEEEIARKNAQISALQAQINPHFLYNTLETINWKAQLCGEQDIAEMIQALSKLMDANMNRSGEKYITVAKEIDYMDSYLFLIQKRYRNKIQYIRNIDPESLHRKLPKLIIQPIIENAINHGIEPIGRGKVVLHIYETEEQLIISVEDNGAGMDSQQLAIVNQNVQSNKYLEEDKGDDSIGLENVSKRLMLIYGNEAGMTIESEKSVGTKVTLMIPLSTELDP